jgi:hypothetical protein
MFTKKVQLLSRYALTELLEVQAQKNLSWKHSLLRGILIDRM